MTTSEVRMNDIFNNYDIKNVVPKPAPKSIRKTLTPLVNNIVFSVDKENKKSSLKKKSTSKTNKNNPIVSTHLKHRVEDFLISNEILSESSTTDSVSYKSSVASGRELRIDNKTEADTQTKSKYTREQLLKFVQNCYGDKKPIMCETEQNRLEDEMCLIEQRKQLLLSPEYKQDLVTTALAMDVNDCAKKSLQESKDARIERSLSKYSITDIYVPFKPKSNRGSPGGYISSRASSAQPPSSLLSPAPLDFDISEVADEFADFEKGCGDARIDEDAEEEEWEQMLEEVERCRNRMLLKGEFSGQDIGAEGGNRTIISSHFDPTDDNAAAMSKRNAENHAAIASSGEKSKDIDVFLTCVDINLNGLDLSQHGGPAPAHETIGSICNTDVEGETVLSSTTASTVLPAAVDEGTVIHTVTSYLDDLLKSEPSSHNNSFRMRNRTKPANNNIDPEMDKNIITGADTDPGVELVKNVVDDLESSFFGDEFDLEKKLISKPSQQQKGVPNSKEDRLLEHPGSSMGLHPSIYEELYKSPCRLTHKIISSSTSTNPTGSTAKLAASRHGSSSHSHSKSVSVLPGTISSPPCPSSKSSTPSAPTSPPPSHSPVVVRRYSRNTNSNSNLSPYEDMSSVVSSTSKPSNSNSPMVDIVSMRGVGYNRKSTVPKLNSHEFEQDGNNNSFANSMLMTNKESKLNRNSDTGIGVGMEKGSSSSRDSDGEASGIKLSQSLLTEENLNIHAMRSNASLGNESESNSKSTYDSLLGSTIETRSGGGGSRPKLRPLDPGLGIGKSSYGSQTSGDTHFKEESKSLGPPLSVSRASSSSSVSTAYLLSHSRSNSFQLDTRNEDDYDFTLNSPDDPSTPNNAVSGDTMLSTYYGDDDLNYSVHDPMTLTSTIKSTRSHSASSASNRYPKRHVLLEPLHAKSPEVANGEVEVKDTNNNCIIMSSFEKAKRRYSTGALLKHSTDLSSNFNGTSVSSITDATYASIHRLSCETFRLSISNSTAGSSIMQSGMDKDRRVQLKLHSLEGQLPRLDEQESVYDLNNLAAVGPAPVTKDSKLRLPSVKVLRHQHPLRIAASAGHNLGLLLKKK